jgi:hypothetical protein
MVFRVLNPKTWSELLFAMGLNCRPASSSLLSPFKDPNCVKLLLLSERINRDCPCWTSTNDCNCLDGSHCDELSTKLHHFFGTEVEAEL